MRQAVLAGGVAASTIVACAGEVAVDGRPCPCAPGFTCCPDSGACYASCPDLSGDVRDPRIHTHADYSGAERRARCLAQDERHVYEISDEGQLAAFSKQSGAIFSSNFHLGPQTMPPIDDPSCAIVIERSTKIEGRKDAYFTHFGLGKVARVSLDSTPGFPDEVGIGRESATFGELITPTALALDETSIYVTELDAGTIKKVPRDGSGSGELVVRTGPHPRELVLLEDRDLVWLDDGGVRSMPKGGGSVVTLSTERGRSLSASGARAYWVTESGLFSAGAAGDLRHLEWTVPSTPCPPLGSSAGGASLAVAEGAKSSGIHAYAINGREIYFASNVAMYTRPLLEESSEEPWKIFDYRVPCRKRASASLLVAGDGRLFWADRDGLRSRTIGAF